MLDAQYVKRRTLNTLVNAHPARGSTESFAGGELSTLPSYFACCGFPHITEDHHSFKLFGLGNTVAEDQDPSVIQSETLDRLNHDLPDDYDLEADLGGGVTNLNMCPQPLHP